MQVEPVPASQGDMEYTLESGSYFLVAPSGIVLMTDSVSMAFALRRDEYGESIVLLKHGTLDLVAKWLRDNAKAVEALFGTEPVAVSFPKHHSVDEINKCLTTSGWVPEFIRAPLLLHWVDNELGRRHVLN